MPNLATDSRGFSKDRTHSRHSGAFSAPPEPEPCQSHASLRPLAFAMLASAFLTCSGIGWLVWWLS